jgi:hypothetical protein
MRIKCVYAHIYFLDTQFLKKKKTLCLRLHKNHLLK